MNQLVNENDVVWISKKFTIAPRTKANPHGMRRNMCSISPLPLGIINKLFASIGACCITVPWLCLASQHLIQDGSRERCHASELANSIRIGKAIIVKTPKECTCRVSKSCISAVSSSRLAGTLPRDPPEITQQSQPSSCARLPCKLRWFLRGPRSYNAGRC